jgi:hypothetical protein
MHVLGTKFGSMTCECKSQGEIQPRNPISPHFFINRFKLSFME